MEHITKCRMLCNFTLHLCIDISRDTGDPDRPAQLHDRAHVLAKFLHSLPQTIQTITLHLTVNTWQSPRGEYDLECIEWKNICSLARTAHDLRSITFIFGPADTDGPDVICNEKTIGTLVLHLPGWNHGGRPASYHYLPNSYK